MQMHRCILQTTGNSLLKKKTKQNNQDFEIKASETHYFLGNRRNKPHLQTQRDVVGLSLLEIKYLQDPLLF